jgi:hypothetical protein
MQPDASFAGGLELVTAERFASIREASAEPLLGGRETNVLPAGALALAYGDGGAGKTTLMLDLGFHLAAGRTWLGLEVPRRSRVGWIENEGPRGNFREKVAGKLAAWGGPNLDGHLLILEEPWARFTFASELHRRELAQLLHDYELDVLVVGPVWGLGIEGGGTPAEVSDFTKLIEETRAQLAKPLAVILIHHENRAGQVAGAWSGVPDTLMHVTPQGNGRTRLFWQKARWASELHGTSQHLLWTDGEGFDVEKREEITEDTIAEGLLAAAREHSGESWTKMREHVKGNATDKARVRDRLIAAGTLLNVPRREGGFNLWRHDDPAAPRSEPGTAQERIAEATPEEGAEHVPFPVPAFYKERGNENGNGAPRSDTSQDEIERLALLAEELGLT